MATRPAWSVSGVVAAPAAATWRALLAVVPELSGVEAGALLELDAARTFSVPLGRPPVGTARVEVDPVRLEVSQQGEWWYRGVVKVSPCSDGSEVTRSIYNVAPVWTRWLVRFVHHHDESAFRSQHATLLRVVGERLQAAAGPRSTRAGR